MVETSDADALPPISAEEPCGPDLDLEGDAEFLNFIAATEGLLPRNYYIFKRDGIDFLAAFQTGDALMRRTHDVRLLVLLAKLAILNRDIAGFAHWLGSLAWVLRAHWDDVHPRAEEGDYSARLVHLTTLEENAVVVMPLQYAPLLEADRVGAVCYRDQMVATGEAQPRSVTRYNEKGEQETSADEKFMPAKTIERLLRDADIARLGAAFDTLQKLQAALASITAVTIERIGHETAPHFKTLGPLVGRMAAFLREALGKRDPALAAPPPLLAQEAAADDPQEEAGAVPGSFTTLAGVDAALGAALGYFAASEPSSPALLLIGQARETLGKNLYEVMKLLAPAHADAARVFVGPDSAFTVPVSGLAGAPGAELEHGSAAPASSRAAALALIDSVATHMRRVEPSSPAPYLLDRAKALASRDFLSLLHDVLPEDNLASMKSGR